MFMRGTLPRGSSYYVTMARQRPLIGVIMGSRSDWETMRHACEMLALLDIPYEQSVVSAHRTPARLFRYADAARARGIRVIIAGAGGAAHLPGMTASRSPLPVLGVPIESKTLRGLDSLLSIAQMPAGIPVGTLAIGKAGAVNAALLAAAILALSDTRIRAELDAFRTAQTEAVLAHADPSAEIPAPRRRAQKRSQRGARGGASR
jgi:5-(carboxyamino)imidazole ribonucleotide mutase